MIIHDHFRIDMHDELTVTEELTITHGNNRGTKINNCTAYLYYFIYCRSGILVVYHETNWKDSLKYCKVLLQKTNNTLNMYSNNGQFPTPVNVDFLQLFLSFGKL